MKVSSPIGDLPFEPRRLRLVGKSIVLEGAMGAWPATVVIDGSDIVKVLRIVPVVAVLMAAALVVVALIFVRILFLR